jgi:hypothetical protein
MRTTISAVSGLLRETATVSIEGETMEETPSLPVKKSSEMTTEMCLIDTEEINALAQLDRLSRRFFPAFPGQNPDFAANQGYFPHEPKQFTCVHYIGYSPKVSVQGRALFSVPE